MRVPGRWIAGGLVAFAALFGAALFYAQNYAFYERAAGVGALKVGERVVPISDYDGIDATSSPLKLRGCFRVDPAMLADAPLAERAQPLVAPFWFDCFDAEAIANDLAAGRAVAYRLESDRPEGFDLYVAVYADGRGYLWRQLNEKFAE
ncbi:DUF6446 family protein [Limibaculum sp. FT325]|uniref:DUF6446 family protein n=1 Tax=Thermohalobaculum sediminis TaxID=2939436 RepID=UPI0020BE1245|nr:DUF6446 family protein [Limibaculum sediminis]MCL5776737.1 DUF6446 family protein [Limibaculum sediminis]